MKHSGKTTVEVALSVLFEGSTGIALRADAAKILRAYVMDQLCGTEAAVPLVQMFRDFAIVSEALRRRNATTAAEAFNAAVVSLVAELEALVRERERISTMAAGADQAPAAKALGTHGAAAAFPSSFVKSVFLSVEPAEAERLEADEASA